jgi:hypothetical protein
MAIAIASAIALMRYQIGIIPVIACTGLIGLSTVFF